MAEADADEGTRGYIGNLLLPLTLLAITAVMFSMTLRFPELGDDVGPEVVPYLWMGFIAVFCGQLVFQALRRQGRRDPAAGKVGSVLLFAGWLAIYLPAITAIGYFVSTFVFLIGSMYMMSFRNAVVMGSVAFGWLVFSYVVFYKILFIPLPIGSLLQPLLG